MTSRYRMAAIFIFSIAWCSSKSCEVYDVAVYKVKLHMMWDEEIFPKEYPGKAQWSQVFGQSHNRSYALYRVGEPSRTSVLDFIQFGTLDPMMEESEEEPKVYDQFIAPAVENGEGETESVVFVDGGHSLVSLISKILPSEEWFIGVDSVDLCLHSSWVDQVTLDLEPMGAGIGGKDNKNPKPVEKVPHRNQVGSYGFYNRNPRQNHPLAKVEFTKAKEYSSKEINNIARKELLGKTRNYYYEKAPKGSQTAYRFKEELTTQNTLQRLKDLEEEPLGSPRPNNPDNNVVVVTKAPVFGDLEGSDESSELDNMDEVVLAVANGNKLGLGKHLPRHFRSRLHHAVNKIHGKDCVVSAWSDWSPCTDPCSNKTRVRTVVQRKRGSGRECPPLVQKHICGRCVRGDGDYIW